MKIFVGWAKERSDVPNEGGTVLLGTLRFAQPTKAH